jgi:hypothetical protein
LGDHYSGILELLKSPELVGVDTVTYITPPNTTNCENRVGTKGGVVRTRMVSPCVLDPVRVATIHVCKSDTKRTG